MSKKITIYGAGYVGLVTGVCFAEMGNDVLIVDVQSDKIHQLQKGQPTIYEPGLENLLQKNLRAGRLNFDTDLKKGVAHGFFQFIAVGTPSNEKGEVDLKYVFDVAKTIAAHMEENKIIINKSTVAVGTAEKIQQFIQDYLTQQRNVTIQFSVLSNPEFLKQGSAVNDFMEPNRIIVGGTDEKAMEELCQLYLPISLKGQAIIRMDAASAELTKYAANAYLATRISFMNEMSQLAERFHADIDMIRQGMSTDQRIGAHFLFAGCGFGGSCFPKDVRALRMMADAVGYQPYLLDAVEKINQQQKEMLFKKISAHFGKSLENKTFALWGLAFKPDTDDMREAPSRVLIDALLEASAKINAYDPAAMKTSAHIYGSSAHLTYCENAYSALENADALIIVTEWKEFANPDFSLVYEKLKEPVIFDGRNMYDPKLLRELGFKYYGVGRS